LVPKTLKKESFYNYLYIIQNKGKKSLLLELPRHGCHVGLPRKAKHREKPFFFPSRNEDDILVFVPFQSFGVNFLCKSCVVSFSLDFLSSAFMGFHLLENVF
jgi:hypothetical protein